MPLKIMAVDDDPQVLRLLQELMGSSGFIVSAFTDSREAAARVGKEKFDAVLVDAKMPHLDGFELVRRIRASPSNSLVPVVMLTGYDNVDTMRKGFHAGITFFLGKPITPKKLRSLLKGLVGPALRERRRYARLPLKTKVTCSSGSKHFHSDSLNISQGGMLLERSGGLGPPDSVRLEFSLPDAAGTVGPQAQVLRIDQTDKMAVVFAEVESDDMRKIQSYVFEVVTL